ncbi:hypothetical protein EWM64_g10935 [Hericium alpestre]|uniref:Uncharacterized protein n=1 Tax=Hericium alpestre TaxID=135208 RepID=A0A4Y9ZGC1_9AGAM|nr:hypothetical protein EWM64_g10935 [Hericium alpestre]
MHRPANDVQLSEGARFMVGQAEYKKHLKAANDQREKGERQMNMDYSAYSIVKMKATIGLFRVHGHKDECIPAFSPNYIIGARQFDGEVVEMLWAPLNEISRSTSGMSTSHRQEVLDDHMNDSNWKKLIGMVNYLSQQHRAGKVELDKAITAFKSINSTVSQDKQDD